MHCSNQEKTLEQFLQSLLELDTIKIKSNQEIKNKISHIISLIDSGDIKVTSKDHDGNWVFNAALKKCILLFIKFSENKRRISDNSEFYDKIDQKFDKWSDEKIKAHGIRYLKGTSVRYGAFVGKKVIMLQTFVNMGCYIGDRTMLDSFSSIGSCAYIGNNCHISANTVIAGTLEPEQSMPVIIEDNCFIGANCSISEGVIVKENSVIASGTNISSSTKIIDPASNTITTGVIPPNSVAVPGSYHQSNEASKDESLTISTSCVIIKKSVDIKTKEKTKLNETLRN